MQDTIEASLREVVNAKHRVELIELFAKPDRFYFPAAEQAWAPDSRKFPPRA